MVESPRSPEWVQQMRQQWLTDPTSVDASWRAYFEGDTIPKQLHRSAPPQPTQPTAVVTAEAALAAQADHPDTEQPAVLVPRSDLPPAPPAQAAEASSPYARSHRISQTVPSRSIEAGSEDDIRILKGIARATARNMDESLSIPTATSQRQIPAKILIEHRAVVNSHLERTVGGKVSFTHLIGYAIVEALCEMPQMNVRYTMQDGKAAVEELAHVGFGLAIDIHHGGERRLVVPVIHDADTLTFTQFVDAYHDIIVRAKKGELSAEDYQGATVTLTNPGTLGTTASVPRLMNGQGLIIGVGSMDYPAEFAGVSPRKLALMGIGKTMFVSSTYDHRVIQGAASGEFLRLVDTKLSGRDGFYERVFAALHIPIQPYAWEADFEYDLEREKGKPARIAELIHAYRSRGHLAADTDPLAYRVRRHPDLDLTSYGLTVWDLDRSFPTGGFDGTEQMLLRDLLARLRDTYIRSIGIEYMHIQDPQQRQWVQERIEGPFEAPSAKEQRRILSTLIHAEAFEEFLQTKYLGQKRFSLEGGESLIPLLDEILDQAARGGIHEVAIAMAHRGRLNVLANLAGKSYAQIFSEFEGNQDPRTVQGAGDVKYHLGTEGIYASEAGVATKVSLAANPSHLEAADGVLEGIVRAKQDVLADPDLPIVPLLIHGDAAFIGQGVVQETLNMSQLTGYKTGGTIHIIVNNQIGFTTGPASGRSSRYPTDLAKGLQIPIFHVNGDDPEAVVRVGALALAYREAFHKDVIIDLVCYRRRGHNEGDDPSMTQPVMYSLISKLPSTREVYIRNLVGRGQLTEEDARESIRAYEAELTEILDHTREHGWSPQKRAGDENEEWQVPESQLPGAGMMIGWTSAVSAETLNRIGEAYVSFPPDFAVHPKIEKLCQKRQEMASGHDAIDWGFAELLAFGSLLMEGTPIRLSGEDARRATFVQRHAVLHDHNDGREFTPLHFLTPDQAHFDVFDSPLSEYAVLAYEYGYSLERPEALVLWEAQFGDFAVGAQTVIDEFVCSAETKWGQVSSLVMLLPHGQEGQGPDHSSARIERYLQLAAEDNMWIVQPSTPANHFHMLRTQAYKRPRKPLIAFTPKQLLRLPAASSPIEEFTSGSFIPVYSEVDSRVQAQEATKVLMCSGRVYYDLIHEREQRGAWDTAIIRVEQLYPLPTDELRQALAAYPNAQIVWVQDEPKNQGIWPHFALNLFPELGIAPALVSRPESATTAAGRASLHREQAADILRRAFS